MSNPSCGMIAKIKKIVCVFLSVAMLMTACSCAKTSAKKTTDDDLKKFIEKQEVTLADQETSNNDKASSYYSLGNAALTLDKTHKVSVRYVPLGDPVFLELKDTEGNVWRLDIPENALPYAETISMQLAGDISTDMVSGQLNAGVVLQPEGLQFIIPATLSITGPKASTDKSFVFFGDQSGKYLNFAAKKAETDKLSVEVAHFSSYILYTPVSEGEFQQAAEMAAESYKEAVKEAKAFLKTPISAPPVPPDYTFMCKDEDGENASEVRNRALDMYIENVVQPEKDLIIKLLASGREVALLDQNQEAFYYAGLLQLRNIKKADKLIASYKNDVDKLIPVMNASLKILKEAQTLGVDISIQPYLDTFSDWMVRAADKKIKEIREEHNYKAMGPAVSLIQSALIFTSDFQVSQDFSRKYLQKLKDAMTFTVNYDVSLHSGIANQRMTLKGKVELSWLDENDEKVFTGKGEGEYVSYSNSSPNTTRIDYPNKYPVNMKFVNFSPCDSKTVDVQVDTIGAQTEVWYNLELDQKSSDEYSFVNFMAEQLFQDYKQEDGNYLFQVPFTNNNAVMGSENFTKTASISYPEEGSASGSIAYTIEIKHTPK
ncbi:MULTISPECIES: hypothetical protein [Dehalobacter]|uniref:Lipoprotein n=2 Tax=Dehalobacter restrictus TaxID=55583 RepID=A0ABN4BV80_DEHRP|nr:MULTISPECIES: hypothetical protein [Dehalobacter]AHF11301.1 hypothetical protein DEHRE_04645 [Dehalobacter restrictus DSM 9455]OCZ53198.1 hypothetical protein A7D23_08925 [Dehalobacter sp. TeCB1]